MNTNSPCKLCGALIPKGKKCIDIYHQLSLYTLGKGDKEFIHQYAVDAYAAQHITEATKPIVIGSSLIGLCLFAEHHYSGRRVQQVHMALGKTMSDLKITDVPKEKGRYNVADVLKASEGENRDAMIKVWASSVWDMWKKEHVAVRSFIHQHNVL